MGTNKDLSNGCIFLIGEREVHFVSAVALNPERKGSLGRLPKKCVLTLRHQIWVAKAACMFGDGSVASRSYAAIKIRTPSGKIEHIQ